MPQSVYPPLNMHFAVEFHSKDLKADISFQSVQGLQVRVDETENKKLINYQNIILKRAYQPHSKLVKWCMDVIHNRKKLPVSLTIKLLNANHEMLSGWQVESAMPVAWGVEDLHAQETKILIETIELAYLRFYVLDKKGNVIAPPPSPELPPRH